MRRLSAWYPSRPNAISGIYAWPVPRQLLGSGYGVHLSAVRGRDRSARARRRRRRSPRGLTRAFEATALELSPVEPRHLRRHPAGDRTARHSASTSRSRSNWSRRSRISRSSWCTVTGLQRRLNGTRTAVRRSEKPKPPIGEPTRSPLWTTRSFPRAIASAPVIGQMSYDDRGDRKFRATSDLRGDCFATG